MLTAHDCDAIIVGAGVAGLTAGYRLDQAGLDVKILERRAEPGGRAGTMELPEGFIADHSAQFLADNYTQTLELIDELGLNDELIGVDEEGFYAVLRQNGVHPLPTGSLGLLTSPAFTWREKLDLLRMAMQFFVRYRPGAYLEPSRIKQYDDVNLGEFVRKRYDTRFVEEIIEPLTAMALATPEQVSLIFGVSMAPLALQHHRVFKRGMGTLARELVRQGPTVKFETDVTDIVIENGKVKGVECNGNEPIKAKVVIGTTPAHNASDLFESSLPDLSRFFDGIPYSTGFHVLYGLPEPCLPYWGVAVPSSRNSLISSFTEETNKSVHRAPDGKGLAQAFVIDEEAKRLLRETDEKIAKTVYDEARELFPQLPNDPLFSRVIPRKQGMVLSEPGYQQKLAGIRDRIDEIEGLYVTGDYLTNPLIEGSVHLAEQVAEKIRSNS
jgi:oxygen-dependent protoporphyrinogen oxidase